MILGKKGQGVAIDFLFAILVFLLLMNALFSLIDNGNRTASDKSILNQLNSRTQQTIDMLVRNGGTPEHWELGNIDNAEVMGLAKRDRALDLDKIEKFVEWGGTYGDQDYEKTKALLLIGYDYYFRISDSDDTTIYSTGQPGDNRWDNYMAVNVKRIVNLEGAEVIAELTIYYPRA